MNIGIIYGSLTGHSRKIATAIGEAVKVQPQNVKHAPEPGRYDLLFVVGGIYGGACHKGLLKYLESIDKANVKQVALVTSSCGGTQKQDAIRSLLSEKGITVIADEYLSLGNFLFFRLGHPNKKEIQGAIDFAKGIITDIKSQKND
ncbi:MAG: flavodoxin domain-containing protein [Candidatus Izemoplasmatales bacterium]|jgi:flavodoxin